MSGRGGGSRGGRRGGRGGGAPQQEQQQQVQQVEQTEEELDEKFEAIKKSQVNRDFLSGSKFSESPDICAATRKAISQNFGFDVMSAVQALSIPSGCQGNDILAKAQTGTGKTIAFCVPAVEQIVKNWPPAKNTISCLILSPTRELASQIHDEAAQMVCAHKGMGSGVIYGGTSMGRDHRLFAGNCDILVATPGRLLDHLANTKGFADMFRGNKMLILDEADRMLEMGFRQEVEKILKYLPTPRQGRQTLLFSATVPSEIVSLAPMILAPEFIFVDAKKNNVQKATTEGKGNTDVMKLVADDPLATAAQVKQDHCFASLDEQVSIVFDLLAIEQQKKDHKIMVFLTTARLAQLYAEVAYEMGINALEIHSRKSQSQREKVSEKFKSSTGVTLFSSDVTARGLDYPDVTYVMQVGAPAAEQYVHRLGRTARAGKSGRGTIVLLNDERFFLSQVSRLKIPEIQSPAPQQYRGLNPVQAMQQVKKETKSMAYSAWMGYYNGQCSRMRWSKPHLVTQANLFALESLQCHEVPSIPAKTIGKMGLKGTPGLNIEKGPSGAPQGGGRGGGGAGRGGYGGDFHGAPREQERAPTQHINQPQARAQQPQVSRQQQPPRQQQQQRQQPAANAFLGRAQSQQKSYIGDAGAGTTGQYSSSNGGARGGGGRGGSFGGGAGGGRGGENSRGKSDRR